MTGKTAYEAYRNHTGGKSLATGQEIPVWEDLPPAIRDAWAAAAAAVVIGMTMEIASAADKSITPFSACLRAVGWGHQRIEWIEHGTFRLTVVNNKSGMKIEAEGPSPTDCYVAVIERLAN
jgi:hypothetical protein